ncbi:MAG: hypothetical protein JOY69_01345 [Candidatus Eremiobacteraeota bacterium]|nr:hypothetical protein [Candidatus Eremiobacteraeota bacterium]MBV8371880.1 hypothetical protein [Candidatus Eremiobacteraeota bacterium]
MPNPIRVRWHRLGEGDLVPCFTSNPYASHLGAEVVGQERALEAWRSIVRSPSFNGAILQDDQMRGNRLVACGAAVFVQSSFAQDELANPRAGLNARIISSVAENAPVVLSYEQLRQGNSRGNLQLAVLSGAFADHLREDEVHEVMTIMSAVFVDHFVGFNIGRILYEAIGRIEIAIHTATMVSRVVATFGNDRALICITPESAAVITGSQISTIFLKHRPTLRLGQAEQELLLAALDELTDEELSRHLNAHVGTIKKRWTKIFERVGVALPSLLADCHSSGDEHLRGKQKRHRVLAYVREHPEELRPYDEEAATDSLGTPNRVGATAASLNS